MKKHLFIGLAFISANAFAQIPAPINSGKIYEDAIKLYRAEKYEYALKELLKIDRNDTNYVKALADITDVYIELENYEEAIKYGHQGLELKNFEEPTFYINLAVAYIRNKNQEEAIKVIDEGLKKFPKNYLLWFNRGAAFRGLDKMPEAIEMFKKTVELNPYYSQAHLTLGLLAAEEGKISQAMLSLNMFLVLEPTTSRSFYVLKKLNEMVSSKYERTPLNVSLSPEGGDDFSESDLIISNYAALGKNYKIPVKTDLAIIKQNHALFSQLKYNKADKGFWMKTYGPFFSEMYKQNMFEAYSYYMLQSSENEKHKALVKKKEADMNKFVSWARPQLDLILAERQEDINGKKQTMMHWYNSREHTLEIIGNTDKTTGKLSGYAEIYYTNGALLSKGNFDKNGNRTGAWTYYHKNGNVSEELNYKEGKLDGAFKVYHPNGIIKREGTYVMGKQNGTQKEYNSAGLLTEATGIKDDAADGTITLYYDLGEKYRHYKGKYVNGKLNDSLIEYYDNGQMASVKLLTNGVNNGEMKVFYRNGQLASQVKYVNDLREGEFKSFYIDGKVQEEGNYKAGVEIGTWKSYYPDGKLEEEIIYDEKGKRNGVLKNYDKDGKLLSEMEYSKGEVIAYRNYDKNGKILKEAKKQKGEFEYAGFYPEGTKRMEGVYTTNGKKGLWKYYDRYGNLESEENFNDKGELDGKVKHYFRNGEIQEENNYKAGKRDGYYAFYYSNGKLKTEGWYQDDKQTGYWHRYYPDGTIEMKEYYLMGKERGYQQYFAVNGKLKKEEIYEDELLQKVIYYDSLGKVSETVELPNGTGTFINHYPNKVEYFNGNYYYSIANGPFKWKHYNGKTFLTGNYLNNRRDGMWKWYYDNGKVSSEGNYVAGQKHGKWNYYFESGKLKKTEELVYGDLHGDVIWYHENGKVEIKKHYQHGEEEGEATYYDEQGELQMVRYYKTGKPVAYAYNDKTGKLITPINIDKPSYKFVSYFQNGNKSREYEVIKGNFEGVYTEYHSNGKVSEITTYKNDQIDGNVKTFYSDGKPKSVGNYIAGYLHGQFKSYHPNGKVKEELNYVNDVLHGVCKYYDINGKLIKKKIYYSDVVIKEEVN